MMVFLPAGSGADGLAFAAAGAVLRLSRGVGALVAAGVWLSVDLEAGLL